MLSDEEIKAVADHGAIHGLGLCTCPCFPAVMNIVKRIEEGTAWDEDGKTGTFVLLRFKEPITGESE